MNHLMSSVKYIIKEYFILKVMKQYLSVLLFHEDCIRLDGLE